MKRHSLRVIFIELLIGVMLISTSCGAGKPEEISSDDGPNAAQEAVDTIIESANDKLDDMKRAMDPGPSGKGSYGGHDLPGGINNGLQGFPGGESGGLQDFPGSDYSGWQGFPGGDGSGLIGYPGSTSDKDHDPEYSYEGVIFTVDGIDINITEFAPAVNAIMDVLRVGDWLIVEGHVNPNVSVYEFYNVNKKPAASFDYEISGSSLIWQDDDLSTAVYAYYNEIYDFWGNQIGFIEDWSLTDLTFIDSTTIGAECWQIDGKGNENYTTLEFEYEPCDSAVLKYYEFLLGGMGQWDDFISLAPEGAIAMVIVNPPEKIAAYIPTPNLYDEGDPDSLMVVGLKEYQQITIEEISSASEEINMQSMRIASLGMGMSILFKLTVPEGAPTDVLEVKAASDGRASWEICQLSGRVPKISKFIVRSE